MSVQDDSQLITVCLSPLQCLTEAVISERAEVEFRLHHLMQPAQRQSLAQ